MSAVRETLMAVAERCEREEPSQTLDFDILDALTPPATPWKYKPYTTSLDAAVTLVPAGWSFFLGLSENGRHAQVTLGRSHPTNRTVIQEGRSLPLALCAAALRAKAAQ